jgi:predicted Zn-dependent protease
VSKAAGKVTKAKLVCFEDDEDDDEDDEAKERQLNSVHVHVQHLTHTSSTYTNVLHSRNGKSVSHHPDILRNEGESSTRSLQKSDADYDKVQSLISEGDALAEDGQLTHAKDKWLEALRFDPGNYKLHEQCAQIFLEEDDVDAATISARKAIKLNPTWDIGNLTLARCLAASGQLQPALRTVQIACMLNPSELDHWEELLKVYAAVKQMYK